MSLDSILRHKPPSAWEAFLDAPWLTLAKLLYSQRQHSGPSLTGLASNTTVVCISDIHNTQPELPEGDILLVAGDLTEHGTIEELSRQLDWLSDQPHLHKIVIAGNHDVCLDPHKSALLNMPHFQRYDWRWDNITYLEDSSVLLELPNGRTLKVYGTPWTKKYGNWAFQYEKGYAKDHFSGRVDNDTDILITHSPPKAHLDVGDGDDALLGELWRVRPRLHCFGHMHEGHGRDVMVYDRFQHLYERVCTGQAGFFTVVSMAVLLLWRCCIPSTELPRHTTIVNAAAIGGQSNKMRRRIQVVRI